MTFAGVVFPGERFLMAAVLRLGVLGIFDVEGPASAFSLGRGRLLEMGFAGVGSLAVVVAGVAGTDGVGAGVGLALPRAFDMRAPTCLMLLCEIEESLREGWV